MHGMGRAPGTEGEGVRGGKTQEGFLGAPVLYPRMKIETPTCGRCEEQVLRLCQRDTGQVGGGLPRVCPDAAPLPQVSDEPWIQEFMKASLGSPPTARLGWGCSSHSSWSGAKLHPHFLSPGLRINMTGLEQAKGVGGGMVTGEALQQRKGWGWGDRRCAGREGPSPLSRRGE